MIFFSIVSYFELSFINLKPLYAKFKGILNLNGDNNYLPFWKTNKSIK